MALRRSSRNTNKIPVPQSTVKKVSASIQQYDGNVQTEELPKKSSKAVNTLQAKPPKGRGNELPDNAQRQRHNWTSSKKDKKEEPAKKEKPRKNPIATIDEEPDTPVTNTGTLQTKPTKKIINELPNNNQRLRQNRTSSKSDKVEEPAKKGKPRKNPITTIDEEPDIPAISTTTLQTKPHIKTVNERPSNSQRQRQNWTSSKIEQAEEPMKKEKPRKNQIATNDTGPDTPAKSFATHWRNIERIFDGLLKPGHDAMGSAISNLSLHSVSQWSAIHGLGDNELKVIWALISHKNSPLNEQQKRYFVKVLIPKEKYHEDNIRAILKWLFKESESAKVDVVNAVLDMIYGWNVYGLVDAKLFSNPVTFNRFLWMCKERVEIVNTLPRLSRVIRKIATLKLITKEHVNLLYAITDNRISDDINNCATELLHYFQYLRPDLFPGDPSYLKWSRSFDNEQLNLSEPLKLALYEGKKRVTKESAPIEPTECSENVINRQSISTINKINQKFFNEFAPHTKVDVEVSSLYLLNRGEAMLVMLRKEETIPLLACDKEALELFNIWASMVFFHRFQEPEEDEKYIFVLDRCLRLSLFLNASLPAVTQWLIKFLPSWDGKLFENEIRELLRFMPLHIMSEKCGSWLEKMKVDFVRGPSLTRFYIWDILDSIILRWPNILKRNLNGEYISDSDHAYTDDENIKEAAESFFREILSLLRNFAAAGGHKDSVVLRNICATFVKMVQAYSEEMIPVKPPVPDVLAQMGILCDEIEVLELCTKLYMILSDLTKQGKYSNTYCGVYKKEMYTFFAKNDDCVPFMTLFKTEYEVVNTKELLVGEVEEGTLDIKGIMQKLTCFYSTALRKFCVDPALPFPIEFDENVFRFKDLKKTAPFLQRQLGIHCPQKQNRKPHSSEMEQ